MVTMLQTTLIFTAFCCWMVVYNRDTLFTKHGKSMNICLTGKFWGEKNKNTNPHVSNFVYIKI